MQRLAASGRACALRRAWRLTGALSGRALLGVLSAGLFAAAPLPASAQTGPGLRVGLYQNEPKIFLDEDGEPRGFLPALVDHLSGLLGWQVDYVPCDWDDCLDMLERDEIQVMPDVAYSPERAARFQFGHEAALYGWSYLFARPGDPLTELEGLDGKRVAVVSDSIQESGLAATADERGWSVELVGRPSMRAVLEAVEAGEVDYGVVNRFFAEANERDFALVRTQVLFQPSAVFFAYSKAVDRATVAAADAALARLKTEPESAYFTLYQEWFEPPGDGRLPPAVYWIGGGVMAALAVTVAIAALLRRRVTAATAALADANTRIALAAQSAKLGVWDWDIVDDRLLWDEATGRLYGRPSGQAEGGYASWREALHPDDREAAEAAARAAMQEGQQFDAEFRIRRPDGEERHVRASGLVLRDPEGKPVRMIGLNMDTTEQKNLEEQLRQSQKLEAMGQLTGGIAHDFNNLLTVILGNAEMLAERPGQDREARHQTTQILLASERASALTNRLLAFSRRQALQPRPTDIGLLIANLEEMLRRPLGATIALRVRVANGLPPAHVDAHQLENALLNLSLNARDAMPDGGSLTIEATPAPEDEVALFQQLQELQPGRYLRIAVRDSGCGMPPSVAEKAFEPFFTTKNVGEGTGLGLSMVYGFVKQSRGHVVLDSTEGRGTVVTLYLPCAGAGR